MASTFVQEALLFSLIILMELVISYYGLQRFVSKLEPVSHKVEDVFLLYTFKQIVNFVSDNDLVQQSLIGSLAGMNDKDLLDFMRNKIGDIKSQLSEIGDGISRFEKARRTISRILTMSLQIRIMIIISLIGLALVIFLPYDAELMDLGLMYGIELVALYYTFLSIFLYISLSRDYSSVLKSIESLETSK
ncbi:hypothetical protein L3N51_00367 [Metallosphaera sp. J1]|uniref:hypothetical protein n=1 Tax=Metallosphaera javensis (ex Hofmann et al. 2022) TaxID=99938 RepID=UPI001EDE9BB1|nr:hypothetical protein [Metallosphaera javensis (ex Hofmann et al. 2022)]MCG3108086.1 hypothetical protein [Metallosphaera javensis (ex Hofmann et al. 2022)]